MGARAREDRIELYVSYSDFNRRIGLINNYYDLESLGLKGHDFSGCFMEAWGQALGPTHLNH